MSRVNQDMSEMRAACAAVDANAEWLRCAKADGIQLWWNIGERGRRQNVTKHADGSGGQHEPLSYL